MIERLFKAFLEFLLVLLVAQIVIGGLLQVLAPVVQRAGTASGPMPSPMAAVVWTVLVGAFGVGLLVRARHWLGGRDHRAAAARDAEARRSRMAVREPAEDVPAYDANDTPPVDPDPALNDEDDDRG